MRSSSGVRRPADGGITLIEMMVVLVIIGVATGAATLGLGSLAKNDAAETAARRLAAGLSQGLDQALITGQAQPVIWHAGGYRIGAALPYVLSQRVTLRRDVGGNPDDATVWLSDMMGPAATVFVVAQDGAEWRVALEGLTVSVAPVGMP